jgi:hypothetical protein
MARIIAALSLIIILECGANVCAADPVRTLTFKNPTAEKAAKDFEDDFQKALATYHRALESARKTAAGRADLEEVNKIDAAIAGEPTGEFSTSSANSARKSFESTLKRLSKNTARDFTSVLKKVLTEGGTEEAERVNDVVEKLSSIKEGGSSKTASAKVYAEKDWQNSGIEVSVGDTVSIKAEGAWGPGTRKWLGKDKWEYLEGDADTYNYVVAIDGKDIARCGTVNEFTIETAGELSFKMANYGNQARRGDAKGALSLKLKISNETFVDDTQDVIRKLIYGGAESSANKKDGKTSSPDSTNAKPLNTTATFNLRAERDWQDTGVFVPAEAKVTLVSTGTWSTGVLQDDKKIKWETADVYNIQAGIGGAPCGKGGAEWEFVAKTEGNLFLRLAHFPAYKRKGDPRGSVQVAITVSK